MAAKDSKGTNSINIAEYFSGIPEGQTLIEIGELNELQADTKRIKAINIDTIFDNFIKELLLSHFSQRDKTVETLMQDINMAKKARLAYALGLIDRISLNDFVRIHNIRNKFAHRIGATFADTDICKECKRLSTAKDQKTVTAKNSYKFYQRALGKCVKSLIESRRQEKLRQAVLQGIKKKTEGNKPKVFPIKLKKVKPIKLKKVKSALKKST